MKKGTPASQWKERLNRQKKQKNQDRQREQRNLLASVSNWFNDLAKKLPREIKKAGTQPHLEWDYPRGRGDGYADTAGYANFVRACNRLGVSHSCEVDGDYVTMTDTRFPTLVVKVRP
jgi:hypothetical protein